MGPRSLQLAAWGSTLASGSLAVASTAWMVSGLTASPFLNGILPALGTVPLLLPLPHRPLLGYTLQAIATTALLAMGARITGPTVPGALVALLALGLGIRIGHPALERRLNEQGDVPLPLLRSAAAAGRLVGNLLTGVLFPLGRAMLQFSQSLVLLLPLLPTVLALGGAARQAGPSPGRAAWGGGIPPASLHPVCTLQGILFGSLFALLPLWVRKVGAGNCFDFGMVLTAYGLGKVLAEATASRLRLPVPVPYLLLAPVLAATQMVPGWVAVLLFLPFGLLAGLADNSLVAALDPSASLLERWEAMGRGSAVGSLTGGLLMGLIAQLTSLEQAFPLQLLAFLVAAPVLSRLLPRP